MRDWRRADGDRERRQGSAEHAIACRDVMFAVVPTLVPDGVPVNAPVAVLNTAQDGLLVIARKSAAGHPDRWPPGMKEYAVVACTVVGGVPAMVGARFGTALTVIENAGKAALSAPSLTAMVMLEYVPTFVLAGVPTARRWQY